MDLRTTQENSSLCECSPATSTVLPRGGSRGACINSMRLTSSVLVEEKVCTLPADVRNDRMCVCACACAQVSCVGRVLKATG